MRKRHASQYANFGSLLCASFSVQADRMLRSQYTSFCLCAAWVECTKLYWLRKHFSYGLKTFFSTFFEFENAVRFDIMKMSCPIFVRPINGQKLQLFELQLFISAREERLELPTLGFGDRCSTN